MSSDEEFVLILDSDEEKKKAKQSTPSSSRSPTSPPSPPYEEEEEEEQGSFCYKPSSDENDDHAFILEDDDEEDYKACGERWKSNIKPQFRATGVTNNDSIIVIMGMSDEVASMFHSVGIETIQQLADFDFEYVPKALQITPSCLFLFVARARDLVADYGQEIMQVDIERQKREEKEKEKEKQKEKITEDAGYPDQGEKGEVKKWMMGAQTHIKFPVANFFAPPNKPPPSQEPAWNLYSSVGTFQNDEGLILEPVLGKQYNSLADFIKSNVSEDDVNPDSSIEVFDGVTDSMVAFLQTIQVFTIRQLATCEMVELSELVPFQKLARKFLKFYQGIAAEKEKQIQSTSSTALYVAHYVPEAVYQQLLEDKMLKSAHVLYREYNECAPDARTFHPWKRVFNLYVKDAAKWVNGGSTDPNSLSDVDVYSFLVWRSSTSFAQFDCTAGPRAIYFCWKPMPADKHEDCLVIDQVIAEDVRDPYIADRFARVVYLDLRKLCNNYNAKVYRVEFNADATQVNTNNWIPTPLLTVTSFLTISSTIWWSKFEPGNRYFEMVPHGCVVTPSGTIPWDCLIWK